MKCAYPGCNRKTAKYFMGWKDNQGNKKWCMVCATHDRFLGCKNLIEAGLILSEAIDFEKEKEES